MKKTKTNISVVNNVGIRRDANIHVGDKGPFPSGDILDANAVQETVDDAVSKVIDTAPDTLDTLKEIAQAIQGVDGITGLVGDIQNIQDTIEDNELIVATALNDLDGRVSAVQSIIDADPQAVDVAIDKFNEIVQFLNGIEPDSILYDIINTHIDNGNSKVIKHVEVMTLAQYNALAVKDPNTEYNII